jgi:hypothetical protein
MVPSGDAGVAAVQVKNLAQDGSPISGEVASSSSLLTYTRVDLATSSDLARVVEALVLELRRQVIDNVSHLQSVDFDAADPDVTAFVGIDIARLPALALTGPSLVKNRFYAELRPEHQEDDGSFSRRSSLATYDLVFKLVGIDNHTRRSFNLQALTLQFFNKNSSLRLQRDPTDSSNGFIDYELEADTMDNTSINTSSDLRLFTGTVTIIGFQFEDLAGMSKQAVVETTAAVDDFNVVGTGI